MKKIHLHSAAVTNAGHFVDAGTDVTVGDGKEAIGADRARELIDAGRAVEAAEPPAKR